MRFASSKELLHATPTLTASDPVIPVSPDVEVLFKEARRRARRRRLLTGGSIVATLSAATVCLFVVTSIQNADPDLPAAAALPRAALQAAQPDIYVVHTPTGTGQPGLVNVMDSGTGQLIRTIGSAYDPYSINSFQLSPDHTTMYYGQLNEAAQTVDLVIAPVDGGPATVMPDAGTPRLSPDGKYLEYANSAGGFFHVKDLSTGEVSTIPGPGGFENLAGSLSWLPDSQHLLLAGSPILLMGYHCAPQLDGAPPMGVCPVPTPPAASPTASILNLDTQVWTPAPLLQRDDGRYGTLLGPGTEPGTVLTMPNGPASPAPLPDHSFGPAPLLTVDTATGAIITTATIPDHSRILNTDTSGTNILILNYQQPDATLDRWEPLTGNQAPLGPQVDEATW
ncbi:hypothetical protein B7R22_11415 [Subtercola boreus]|uniref:Lipoprotein LpqB beta-propeller domain-containing protein n=1 Tax=Subtercola boreus TaxID=120213 RepID=A0A3E0VWX5_9MICO|nr:hypothetical protein [Subtercola boreus]RFA13858.1 hypothetical protein B7R22_11415 [Subtercola boreus]